MAPIIANIQCIQCECSESLLWKSVGENQHICNNCFERSKNDVKNEANADVRSSDNKVKLRKSTRTTRYNGKSSNATNSSTGTSQSNANTAKGGTQKPPSRGRRNLYRRPPMKVPVIPATTQHVKSLFYKNYYLQIGDIVSLCNSNNDTFYAQIRGLIVDSFCEKSAVITWLLPTKMSPPPNEDFDPSTYIIGPEEDQPRLLSCMEFVMHAPSDYYHNKNTPYPPLDTDYSNQRSFIWVNTND